MGEGVGKFWPPLWLSVMLFFPLFYQVINSILSQSPRPNAQRCISD